MKKSLPSKKFLTWPDETDQAYDGDLMVQSAGCQTWMMCSFRGWQATWSPKLQTNFFPKTLWLTRPTDILSVNCLLSLRQNDFLLLFSPSALNWIAHKDLKMLFMIESYTYLSKCQMCSQVAKSDFSVEI